MLSDPSAMRGGHARAEHKTKRSRAGPLAQTRGLIAVRLNIKLAGSLRP